MTREKDAALERGNFRRGMILLALLVVAVIWFVAFVGCTTKHNSRVIIAPDWDQRAISYYWPGETAPPGIEAWEIDCKARTSLGAP